MPQFLLSILVVLFLELCTSNTQAQTNALAAVGSYADTNYVDVQLNYFMFLERVFGPWTCYFTGNGGNVPYEGDALGLGWDRITGADVLTKLSSPPYQFQIGMYLFPDLDSAYGAALNGCADFEPFYLLNRRARVDLRQSGQMLGAGPPTWMTVSAGYSTSTNCELPWGPQLEFIDAIRDITDPSPSVAMSFTANCTAARYANLKYSRPDWNVFDLRQGLRQASTFYNPAGGGWREDGGYGFPRVPNLTGDSLPPPTMVPTNKEALDAAPPLQPTAVGKSGLNGPQVAFRWYNFKQSTFDHTRVRIGTLTMDAGPSDSALNWDVGNLWPLTATNAEFFTVLTNQTTSPPEAYTSVPIPPIIAQPQFNSENEFQFSIYAFPCTSVSNQFVRVYMSSDLKYWNLLQALCLPDGKAVFKDSAITNANCRFYRLVQGNLHSQSLGFTRVRVAAGKAAIIANQLDHCNNTVSNLFSSSVIPGPASLAKDNSTNTSSYNPTNQTWSNPTLSLSLGEAAWFTNYASQDCIIRFVGDVNEGVTSRPLSSGKVMVGLMIPVQFNDYVNYELGSLGPDPLAPGSTVRRWDGTGFVSYTNLVSGWTPQMPPIQPGEGFSIQPGFSIPTNQPTEWGMAFSGVQQVPYTSGLQITQMQIQGSDVVLAFTSNPGGLYILEYSDDDSFSTWTQGPDIVGGTGDIVLTAHLKGATNNKRFYRIRQLPPNP